MPATAPITVLIVDDHPIVRKGLRDLLATDARLCVVAEAENGLEALDRIEELQPSVVLLDIDMPGMSGLDVTREVAGRKLSTAVVILTMYDDEDLLARALENGAAAYILKDCAPADIIRGIAIAAEGGTYVSPTLGGRVLRSGNHGSAAREELLGISSLTPAERRVLRLISEEKTTEEIALLLFISPKTVEKHRSHICEKLEITGHNALVRYAMKHREKIG